MAQKQLHAEVGFKIFYRYRNRRLRDIGGNEFQRSSETKKAAKGRLLRGFQAFSGP
jgi:hypothetical protein